MIFSYNKYLRPITNTDRSIQIIDNSNIVHYTINPFSVLSILVSNNLLKINLKSQRVITIPFSTNNEAKLAISTFQQQLDTLKSKTPGFIDKQIENYVDVQITSISFSNVNYGNGLTLDSGTLSVGGTLSNTLYLDGQDYDLIGVGFDNISFTSSVFDIFAGLVSIDSSENVQILADSDVTLFANGQLALTGNSGLVSIGNTQGLVYYTDYSSGFVDRSLVDKAYVDSKRVITFGATNSVVVYDYNIGNTFYHPTASTNYSANFINIPETDNKAITTKIIISQGLTAYSPSSISINGVTQSVKWLGGTYSTSSNSVDVVEFTFLRTNSWEEILGQISSFS